VAEVDVAVVGADVVVAVEEDKPVVAVVVVVSSLFTPTHM
jgi:hypothetical protein